MSNSQNTSNPQREAAQENNSQEDVTKRDQFVAEEHDGSKFTINETSDPQYPEGSNYISRESAEGVKDDTMIVSPEGEILNEARDNEEEN
ncbi:MAG TPA: hypothetical protein VF571_09305 [Pyrinomonadaceae bacterium]